MQTMLTRSCSGSSAEPLAKFGGGKKIMIYQESFFRRYVVVSVEIHASNRESAYP